MSFDDIISDKLRTCNLGFREDGKKKYFKSGMCPSCQQKTLYIRKDKLNKVVCNRKTKCGYTISIRELFPELFRDLRKQYLPTEKEPNKTADMYMSIVRGFPSPDSIKELYVQKTIRIGALEYPTVRFYLSEDPEVYWEKIIDCKTRTSNFSKNEYKGLAWSKHPKSELTGEVYLTEGIFDALALEEAGKKEISSMSCGHIPETFLEGMLGKKNKFYIAYDNDKAGLDGAEKIKHWFESKGETAEFYLPEKGKDWNDHLITQQIFKAEFQEDCLFRGRLEATDDAREYGKILAQKYHPPICYEFGCCYYGLSLEKEEYVITRQSTFILKLLYTLKNEVTEEVEYIFQITLRNGTKPKEIRLNSAKIANLQAFREGVLNRQPGAVWKGQQQMFFFNLLERYFYNPPIEVRFLEQVGYDMQTNAYVFPDHAYNSEGALLYPNKHQYIELDKNEHSKVKILPKAKKDSFQVSENFDWNATNLMIEAWGWEGYCVFAWFFVSLFSEQIGKEFGWFPFMSIFGPPNTGKSTLINWAWKALGRLYEGEQVSDNFSPKFIARRIASFSGIPSVIKEVNKVKTKFDLETFLPAFDRDSISGRAQVTHGLETNEYQFKSSLIFAQNDEPFDSPALKSRIISLYFSDDRFNITKTASLIASKKIKSMMIQEVCGFRHCILSEHPKYLKKILEGYQKHEKKFLNMAETSRVAQNYALLWAGCEVLSEHIPKWKELKNPCFKYLSDSIKYKERMLKQDTYMLNRFFEVLEDLIYEQTIRNHAPYERQKEIVRFSWKEFQYAAMNQRQTDLFKDVPELQKELQGSARFNEYASMHSSLEGKNIQLWEFSGDFSDKKSKDDNEG